MYLGGKKRLAKKLAEVLVPRRAAGERFVDVFCGSLAVSAEMPNRGYAVANDACVPLINMYKAWREGWRPPAVVSESLYAKLKSKQDPSDPLTAFAGFHLSWGGKWFCGYARGWVMPGTRNRQSKANGATEPADFVGPAVRSVDGALRKCAHVRLESLCFRDLAVLESDIVYCDPEYRSTTRYNYFKNFDNKDFEAHAQRWADNGSTVFVSEYAAQSSTWELLAQWTSSKNIAKQPRVEKLFRVRPR